MRKLKAKIDPVTGEILQNELGQEILDPTPMAPPVGYKRQKTLAELMREMIRSEKFAAEQEAAGNDTFEEAEDFDVDDYDPTSPYEDNFDPPIAPEPPKAVEPQAQKSQEPQAPSPSPEPPPAGG